MEDTTPTPLNIDELTPKQRIKEFKITVKDIKAKDVSKKMMSLEKYRNDPRYLLEGESLAPLIESFAPKKKTLEYLRPGLETLINFLQGGNEGQNFCLDGCNMLSRTTESLNVLGVVAEVAVYQEEVKKPKKVKKVKKGEVAPPPPVVKENQTVVKNRYLSCQVLSLFAKTLFTCEDTASMVTLFVAIPDLLQNLCKVLQILEKSMITTITEEDEDVDDNTLTIEALGFVLDALLMVLRNGTDSTASFLLIENIVTTVTSLVQCKELTLKSLQVFQYLSSQENGLATAAEESLIATMISIISESAESVVDAIAKSGDSSSKKDKKDSKKGGGGEEEINYPAIVIRELSVLTVVVDILTAISKNSKASVNVTDVAAIIKTLSPIALNQDVWTHCNVKPEVKADPCIVNLVRNIGILFGCYALIEEDIRVCAVEGGGIRVLLDVLTASQQVVAPPQEEEGIEEGAEDEAAARLHEIRHVLEKAILHLTTIKLLPSPVEEDSEEAPTADSSSIRWKSCSDFVTDCEALRSSLSATGEDLSTSNISVLIDLLANEDDDIANRSSRLISILLMGTTNNDPVAFLRDMELDDGATVKLTAVLLNRASALSVEIEASSVTSNMEDLQISEEKVETNIEEEEEEKEEEEGGEEEENNENVESDMGVVEEKDTDDVVETVVVTDAADEVKNENKEEKEETVVKVENKVKIQKLHLQEVLCNVMCCLEYLLNVDVSYIATFSSEDVVQVAATLLNRCGPTCNNQTAVVKETLVNMSDPRRFDWNTEELEHPGDELILRELIFDLLTIVGSSDAKYRDFGDATLPQEPCTPFPESTCPCATEAMRVFSMASNSCLVTLLCSCDFVVKDSIVTASPSSCRDSSSGDSDGESTVSQPVTEAALRMLHAIAGSGMPGIEALYNAIAAEGFDVGGDQTFSPLAYFETFLTTSVAPLVESQEDEESQQEQDPFSWAFPTLFRMQGENEAIVTHTSQVMSQKVVWPFLVAAGAVLGILANPLTKASTATLAVNAASSLSRITNIAVDIQPAATDMFSGSLLGLGGAVVVSGCLGLFGPLHDDHVEGESWLTYLVQRGSTRQYYWDVLLQKKIERENELTEEEIKANAKNNKLAGKKDDSKAKRKSDLTPNVLELPFEPDEDHPDPNHGPCAAVWSSLLNVGTADLHASAPASQPLIAAIQGGLSSVAQELIIAGAAVDAVDCYDLTPLNHSVVLGFSDVSAALIQADSDINHLDNVNNSMMKYSFFAITSSEELIDIYKHCRAETGKADKEGLSLWGSEFFVQEMLEASADLNVSDEEKGNFPLHNAIGMGTLGYMLGGVLLTIKSKAHQNDSKVSVPVLQSMVSAGAAVNAVNREGVSVMHALSALGDLPAIEFLLTAGAYPNVVDGNGCMPLHYLSAACPDDSVAVATVLLEQGARRPLYRLPYEDPRTGKSLEEKYAIDAEKVLSEVLGQTTCPHIVTLARLSAEDLLLAATDQRVSVLQLAMCGDMLAAAAHLQCLVATPRTSIENRISLFEYFKRNMGADTFSQLLQGRSDILSAVQAYSLMQVSRVSMCRLHDNESSSEEVTEFMSTLQSTIFGAEQDIVTAAAPSGVAVLTQGETMALPAQWTPVHCAIVANTKDLLDALLFAESSVSVAEVSARPYVHFIAGLPCTSNEIALAVLSAAANSEDPGALLNSSDEIDKQTPLHLAVACQNRQFVENMLLFDQVDVNVVDEQSGRSAFFEAILSGDASLVKAFITTKSCQLLDVSVEDVHGKTAIEYAFEERNINIIEALSYDFSSSCIEKLACIKEEETDSLLMQLELENMEHCGKLGMNPPVVEEVKEEVAPKNDDEEELDLDLEGGLTEGKADEQSVSSVPLGGQLSTCSDSDLLDTAGTGAAAVLTDLAEIADMQTQLERSNTLLTLVMGLLQEANIVAKDGHAHECFFEGQLYSNFCSKNVVPSEEDL